MKTNKKLLSIAAITLGLSCGSAMAAGFEKTVMWSGEWTGVAGAATGAVEGGDSLFFNPAGLVHGEDKELSFNFSPLFTHVQGAQTENDESIDSEKEMRPVFGFTSKMKINEDFAVGAGLYVSGGSGAGFDNVKYTGFEAYKPNVMSKVQIVELGLGGAYKIDKNFSVGATYRITMAQADLASAAKNDAGTALLGLELTDLTGYDYSTFRLGAQYRSDDKSWGLGVNYRSELFIDAEGDAKGKISLGGAAPLDMTGSKATAETYLPQQINIGGFYKYTPKSTIFLEYGWTEYSKNKEIKLGGDLSLPAAAGGTNVLEGNTVVQNWHNMNIIRIGNATEIGSGILRVGYAYTSQVTNSDAAAITYSAPGAGHTFAFGGGRKYLGDRLLVDGALEYSYSEGRGTKEDVDVSGDYESSGVAAHLSAKYLF